MRHPPSGQIPAPSLLVLAGLAVGLVPVVPRWHLPPEVMTLGVLPPLLFAAALEIPLAILRRVWRPVIALAFGLVAVTAVVVAVVTRAVDGSIGVAAAFTLGAVLSSTDPVAVTALSRRLRLPARVATVTQSESLFNDATSLVFFQVAVGVAVSGHAGGGDAVAAFLRLGGGGALLGAATGTLARVLLRRERRAAVIISADVALPYLTAVVASLIGVSGVAGVIVCGLVVATPRRERLAEQAHRRVVTGYGRVVLALEHAAFLVIGLQLAVFLRELPAGQRGTAVVLVGAATLALLLVRAPALLAIAAAAAAAQVRRGEPATTYRAWQAAAVVTWAGTRGVVPLAAALAIPERTDSGALFPHRPLLLVVATGVVVVTLVVQGTTLRPLVARLGVTEPP